MISHNFISNIKFLFSALDINNNQVVSLSLEDIKKATIEVLFRLKDSKDAPFVYYSYKRIIKKWKKIRKAVLSHKWNEVTFSNFYSIAKRKNKSIDISYVTNMFSSKAELYYLDDKNRIIINTINKNKNDSNSPLTIIKGKANTLYLYEKKYILTLKRKSLADTSKAIAFIQQIIVDSNRNKYISFINFNIKGIEQSELYKSKIAAGKAAKLQICKKINDIVLLQIAMQINILTFNTYAVKTNFIRINSFHRF